MPRFWSVACGTGHLYEQFVVVVVIIVVVGVVIITVATISSSHLRPATGSAFSASSSIVNSPCRPSAKILKRIPKASRDCCRRKLAAILGAVVADNNHEPWYRLLRFGDRCLRQPIRGGKRWPLASAVNQQIESECDHGTTARPSREPRSSSKRAKLIPLRPWPVELLPSWRKEIIREP